MLLPFILSTCLLCITGCISINYLYQMECHYWTSIKFVLHYDFSTTKRAVQFCAVLFVLRNGVKNSLAFMLEFVAAVKE